MTMLEDAITRSIEEHLADLPAPRVDVEAARRSGERRRALSVAAVGLAACLVAVLLVGVGLGGRSSDTVQPVRLPGLDLDQGARAFYDEATQRLHVGGRTVDIGRVQGLDTSAAATPYGVLFFDDDQAPWLVAESGEVRRLAAGAGSSGFHPTVKFDARQPLVAWLTGDPDHIRLTVYRFGEDEGTVGTADVPCDGKDCEFTAVAGLDHGRVLVRLVGGAPRTLVYDLDDLEAGPAVIDGFRAADVRNRVVLGEGSPPASGPLGARWRYVRAEGPESLLTFDGRYEVYWSSRLRATDGGPPLRLDVPGRGVEFVAVDTDGSVLVAVSSRRSTRYVDCPVPRGRCETIGRLGSASGDPMFLGVDM